MRARTLSERNAGTSPYVSTGRNDADITADGDGSQIRDFVHVDDIVQANLLAATTDAVGGPYNIGTGIETSVLDLAEAIQNGTDTDSEIVHTAPRPADIDHSVADIAKARDQLNYDPRVSLRDGIEAMAEVIG